MTQRNSSDVGTDEVSRERRHCMRAMFGMPLAGLVAGCGGGDEDMKVAAVSGKETNASVFQATDADSAPPVQASPTPSDPPEQAVSVGSVRVPADPRRNYVFGPWQPPSMTGWANVGLGESALLRLTTGVHNTAIGDQALWQMRDGRNCVGIGALALFSAQSAFDCTAVGTQALFEAATGVGGTAVGRYAAASLRDAGNNTAVGDSAMRFAAEGVANVVVGYTAGQANLDGSYNTIVGAIAGRTMLHGGRNVIIGAHAMGESAHPCSDNVVVGSFSMEEATGDGNVAIGNRAAKSLVTGRRNVFVGCSAGDSSVQKADAENVVVIGHGAQAVVDHQVVIGNDETQVFSLGGVMFTKAELQALLALVRQGGS